MINLVSQKLGEIGLPVLWQIRPESFPSLTFSFLSEYGEIFADDKEIETAYLLQVDIWSKDDYSAIAILVKTKLSELGFHRTAEYDDYENNTKIYHKILRFSYLKETESEV
ncbi:hypothetical protein [Acinetobacter sp.]|uniref:hypothetical protein n=1 Tax=Acinetobacter sp. TaxID=472 RepID=UPI003CFFCA00